MSEFFDSRWVHRPEHVTEIPGSELAGGFRAAGVAAGIKPGGDLDVGLLVSDAPETVSAARFTASGVLAAPVLVTQDRTVPGALRAVAANAGNANAATGAAGMETALEMQAAAGQGAGVDADRVAVASTGVIGVVLDKDVVARGLRAAAAELGRGYETFATAIMTTDQLRKQVTVEVALEGGPVRISAQAKGAGMISPRFATLLCFVQTDAALNPETAQLLLGVCVKRSFDRVSVDGQLSTNDTVILQASGVSGVRVEPETTDERRLGEALDAVLRQLALLLIRDGEGAKRVARVVVEGGHQAAVDAVARKIANSPLVKAALHGGDPNWGRIAQAAGAALPGTAPLALDIWVQDTQVCAGGAALPFDGDALTRAVAGGEVEYAVRLPGEGADTEVFFSDLSHEYVTINADYTS